MARVLRIADLQPGDVGVLHAIVEHATPQRTYKRKRGGEGTMARVTLADDTGTVDLVLWDEETSRVADGTFAAGARIVLRGALVKAGHRGGIELGLASALVERAPGEASSPADVADLAGILLELGPSRVAGDPPVVTITADALLRLEDESEIHLVAAGPCLLALRQVEPGAALRVVGAQRNPVLPGWYWTPPGASIVIAP